ncbi:TPA: hypothetical protein J1285_004433 [Escherichia coli]|nr:hypothetical protein [Escherichia coli]HBA6852421.1 hypothetical protein [Escherichia coli]HBA6867421.1 hypothetical protein [Escherichia coli]HBA7129896.1 hypothetical protein [Escherichia coli]HBA8023862.1 hypothetical protein [Escherichia coli]
MAYPHILKPMLPFPYLPRSRFNAIADACDGEHSQYGYFQASSFLDMLTPVIAKICPHAEISTNRKCNKKCRYLNKKESPEIMGIIWSEFVLLFNTNPRLVTFIWTVSAFGLGAWLGHWLAKNRDKRKEFNAVADELFLILDAFREGCRDGKRDMPHMSRDDFRRLRPHLSSRQARSYQQAVDNFFNALKASELYEDRRIVPVIKTPAEILPSLNTLIKFLKHR